MILLSFLLAAFGCTKESDYELTDYEISYREAGAKKYDEMACIVDNKAGIRCFESLGKTCKREKSCTAVESLGGLQYFSAQELAAWPNVDLDSNAAFKYYMWQIDWFIHPDEDN